MATVRDGFKTPLWTEQALRLAQAEPAAFLRGIGIAGTIAAANRLMHDHGVLVDPYEASIGFVMPTVDSETASEKSLRTISVDAYQAILSGAFEGLLQEFPETEGAIA